MGHYYAFILDHSQNKWRKYNDRHIKEVKEEDVLKEAYGNHLASAYCLIYFSEKLLNSAKAYTAPDNAYL